MAHCYIVGKSGSGKSTYLLNELLRLDGGFCLLDPHGDLAEAVADTVDCIYWEPPNIGFNPVEHISENDRPLVAAQIRAALKAVFDLEDDKAPRLLWILYNCLRLLLDNNGSLLDKRRTMHIVRHSNSYEPNHRHS